MRHIQRSTALLAIGLALLLPAAAGAAGKGPRVFFSPEAAAQALVAAARAGDDQSMLDLFGHDSADLIEPDPAFAAQKRAKFTAAADERLLLRREGEDRVTVVVGYDAWPLPIPIVRGDDDTWYFDAEAGREELINRVIGANELNAIAVLRAYVDAQKQYASKDRDGDGVREFAQRLLSTPGKQNGLYWEGGDEESPFGPLIAAGPAVSAGASSYRGYKFRILKQQGPQAPGGPYSYVINGRMLAGYALLAWPAQYGRTGIMSFMVNHYGTVYQRDLGPKTGEIAAAIKAYNPGKGWVPVD